LLSRGTAIAAAAFLCLAASAGAQSYPTRVVRLVAPYPPGGGVDAAARIVAQFLGDGLGQQVIVDNRGGASGLIGTELAARSPGDGYTLVLGSVAPNAILPAANPRIPYNAAIDFAPISLVASSDYVLAVHPSTPVRSVRDLLALARSRPGEVAYASTGTLGGPHLAGEMLSQLGKVKMVHIPYKGGGPATTAILSGEVSVMFGSAPTVVPHAKAGRLRLVATTGPKRSRSLPDLPAVAEALPGHEVTQWYGVLAPAGTPAEIVDRIAGVIAKAVQSSKVAGQFSVLGAEATSSTPQQFAAHIKAEIVRWEGVVKAAGLQEGR